MRNLVRYRGTADFGKPPPGNRHQLQAAAHRGRFYPASAETNSTPTRSAEPTGELSVKRSPFWKNYMKVRRSKRESLMALRKKHLEAVDSLARGNRDLDDNEVFLKFYENYKYFFGPLRSAAKTVPSDRLRERVIVMNVIDMAKARRIELAQS
jgi:hypothetical protein